MHLVLGLVALVAGIALVIGGADVLVDGLLGAGRRLGVSPFALTVIISGLELENLAAGIAANAKGLPGAAAGTFLGGTTFVALAVAGAGALIAPLRPGLPGRAMAWSAAAPLPLVALAADGRLSRVDGALLVVWFAIALTGMARSAPRELEQAAEDGGSRRFPTARLVGGLALLAAGGTLL